MDEKMDALVSRGTWELVSAPKNVVVGCRWIYTLKYCPMVKWISIRLDLLPKVILGPMTWITLSFSLVARLNYIMILFSIAVNLSWPLFQWMSRMPYCMVI